jgi:hypothetical protein
MFQFSKIQAGEICLVKEKSENNLNYYRVVSCHPVYERCCRTGCCAVQDRDKPPVQISDDVERKLFDTKVKAFLFNVLVIAVVVFLLYIVICIWVRMCLQVHRANSAPVGITTNNSHPQEVSLMLSFNSAGGSRTNARSRFILSRCRTIREQRTRASDTAACLCSADTTPCLRDHNASSGIQYCHFLPVGSTKWQDTAARDGTEFKC